MSKPRLFTYCIPVDHGAAPNPYWGVCTLNICKPVIRRVAGVGDWVVGTGSARLNYSNHVVYAMKVTQKMKMEDYDLWVKKNLPEKEVAWRNKNTKRRLGDSIYDFSSSPPILRKSVHKKENMKTDLGGQFTLLSTYFYYFGDKAIILPNHLLPIVKKGQGHQSSRNEYLVTEFISWIEGLGKKRNKLYGRPQIDLFGKRGIKVNSCAEKREDAP